MKKDFIGKIYDDTILSISVQVNRTDVTAYEKAFRLVFKDATILWSKYDDMKQVFFADIKLFRTKQGRG